MTDAPQIANGAVLTGSIVEDSGTYSVTNTFLFTDATPTDSHGIDDVVAGSGALGQLDVTLIDDAEGGADTGQISWTYTVTNSAINHLAADAVHIETFTIKIVDTEGNVLDVPITITITGTNDAPVITTATGQNLGSVVEAGLAADDATSVTGPATASGTLTSTDVDTGATATWSGGAAGTYGSFAINATTGAWT